MSALRALPAALALVALPGPRLHDGAIAYAPEPGTTLERTYVASFSMQLESMLLTLNGEEVQSGLGELHISLERRSRLIVTDVIEGVSAGRPTRLRRTFDLLEARESTRFTSGEHEESSDRDHGSALEGTSVAFEWGGDEEAFSASFAEPDGADEELLAHLVEDMDLRRFLPARAVEEGESWEVDALAFLHLLDPGGDLGLVAEGAEAEDTSAQDQQLRDTMSGTILATHGGSSMVGGRRLVSIQLEIETAAYTEKELSAEQVPEGGSGTERVDTEFRLEGQLLWDIEHGHAHSLELSGANEVTMRQVVSGYMGGEPYEQAQIMSFGGRRSLSARFERP
jgi:hypothetical protein